MIRKFTLIIVALSCWFATLSAQQTWTLERCIQYAQQNSLQVKQAEYAIEDAQLQEKASRLARYPNLNGSISGGIQTGRTIDPVSNDFVNEAVGFNRFGLNTGATLFNGFRIKNTILQSEINTKAARADAAATQNVLALNIATSYLQILLAEEQLQNANRQKRQTQDQLDQTDKLIRAGVLPANDRLDILAQLAINDQTIVQAENSVETSYLALKNLLELPPDEDIRVEKPSLGIPANANPESLNLESVYVKALTTQPQIEAGDLRKESAEIGIDLAKAGQLPQLTVFGGLSTNWSSAARDFENPDRTDEMFFLNDPVPVVIGGTNTNIATFGSTGIVFPNKGYGTQIGENFGQNIGLQLSIPIYNNGTNDVNIERAKLNVLNSDVQQQQAKQNLKADIQRAIADARAAKKSFEAAERAQDAARAAFVNAEKRFTLGAINTFEYTTAKANLDRSEIDLTQAKFQYIFNMKVVDFYMGNRLTID